MKYRIDSKYVWYNEHYCLVLMYFINNVPFTFDDVPEEYYSNSEIIALANKEKHWTTEEIYLASMYLIDEECHPLMFELELENPECMPTD